MPVELTQTVPVERAHPTPPAAMLQTNAWLEKLRSLQERARAAKEAVRETERRAQFNRDWDNLRSVPSPSALPEALSHVNARRTRAVSYGAYRRSSANSARRALRALEQSLNARVARGWAGTVSGSSLRKVKLRHRSLPTFEVGPDGLSSN